MLRNTWTQARRCNTEKIPNKFVFSTLAWQLFKGLLLFSFIDNKKMIGHFEIEKNTLMV